MAINDQDYTSGIKTGAELKVDAGTEFPFGTLIIEQLKRIATAQEQMVAIAMEAREERLKLSAQMKERLKAGFAQEK